MKNFSIYPTNIFALRMRIYLMDVYQLVPDKENKMERFVNKNGTQEWWLNDNLHREDGPAVVKDTGYMAWYRHGN